METFPWSLTSRNTAETPSRGGLELAAWLCSPVR